MQLAGDRVEWLGTYTLPFSRGEQIVPFSADSMGTLGPSATKFVRRLASQTRGVASGVQHAARVQHIRETLFGTLCRWWVPFKRQAPLTRRQHHMHQAEPQQAQ